MKIAKLIENTKRPFFSLEFFPPKDVAQWPKFFTCVEQLQDIQPLFTSVTYGAGGSSQDNTLEIAIRLQKMGLEPMAHLTCVGSTPDHISDFLMKLRTAGIDNILALRGDPPKNIEFDWNTSEFKYAEDLVRYVRRVEPHMGIGVAGYPAPHPESPSFESDRAYTLAKVKAGAEFVITQVFFDVREYFELVDSLRRNNINIPVIPGILPVQSLESIKTVLGMCGANIPGKLFLQLEQAHIDGGEDAVRKVGLDFAVQQIRQLLEGGAPGIHLYTLNRSALCLRLVEAVKDYI